MKCFLTKELMQFNMFFQLASLPNSYCVSLYENHSLSGWKSSFKAMHAQADQCGQSVKNQLVFLNLSTVMMILKVSLLLLVQPVRLEFHCSLVCVLNLQTLTQAICLVFSYLCLTCYSLSCHSKVSFDVFWWKIAEMNIFEESVDSWCCSSRKPTAWNFHADLCSQSPKNTCQFSFVKDLTSGKWQH